MNNLPLIADQVDFLMELAPPGYDRAVLPYVTVRTSLALELAPPGYERLANAKPSVSEAPPGDTKGPLSNTS
jgi:hypothetical protein